MQPMPITTNIVSLNHAKMYNIMWSSLSVTCSRLQYNWNIVESGVKHHNPNTENRKFAIFQLTIVSGMAYLWNYNRKNNQIQTWPVYCGQKDYVKISKHLIWPRETQERKSKRDKQKEKQWLYLIPHRLSARE